MLEKHIEQYIHKIVLPNPGSHKGENGRVLVIGGSRLFHAASFWAATMASKIVDMVHFTSPAMENNDLMRVRAKSKFWEGIVVDYADVGHYIEEDDCILIGPGMTRSAGQDSSREILGSSENTQFIVNSLLKKYPDKKWVVDGGALQMVDPALLTESMIITPNAREVEMVREKLHNIPTTQQTNVLAESGLTILAKGAVDVVSRGEEREVIQGGNAGMTKGGTGDVLAGLVAGLYAKSEAMSAAVVGSYVNKRAGEKAAEKYGVFYSASDIIPLVQRELAELIHYDIVKRDG